MSLALPGATLLSPTVAVTAVVFLAASAVWTRRLAPDAAPRWTVVGPLVLAVAPTVGVAIASSTDRAVPVVALVAVVALALQGAQLRAETQASRNEVREPVRSSPPE